MNFTLATQDVEGFPVVVATGPITTDSLIELGRYIRTTCENAGVKGTIIDCAAIEGALSPESLYQATPAYTNEVGRSIRVAYINPPAHWKPADDQFSRDLAHNRGGMLELFDTAEDAVGWLRGI
jgi:hypothetical protein